MTSKPHTVIVGAGFSGLYAARALGRAGYPVTIIDRRNFHLFQPLLYQVATGGLSPGDISSPVRAVLGGHRQTTVLTDVVVDIDADRRRVLTATGAALGYDQLVVASGVRHDYFGNDEWSQDAPGLKTVEDALNMRRRVLDAFERAERESEATRRDHLLTFVIVGGGPTGVELAGALAELSRATLRGEFRRIDPAAARVYLVEGEERILPGYAPALSARARRSLERLGVKVLTGTTLKHVDAGGVDCERDGQHMRIPAGLVLWAAGMRASPLGRVLRSRAGAKLDGKGRVVVTPRLTVAGHPDISVIGDLAHFPLDDGSPLPGVAQVAIQQGRFVARRIQGRIAPDASFHYRDHGNLAVIGRNRAVAEFGRLHFSGFAAWLIWVFIHIAYLIEYDNRVIVMAQWAMNYFTRKRGARLITGPLVSEDGDSNEPE